MNVSKPIGLVVCLSVLQACGGSGGTSATLQSASNTDKKIQIDFGTFDLNAAALDNKGPGFASQYDTDSGNWQPPNPIYFWGQRLTDPRTPCTVGACPGPVISRPLDEVIDAWKAGWTGKNVNVLIEDSLTEQHGVITGLLAYRYAPAANFYGLNIVANPYATNIFFNQLNSDQTGSYGNKIKLGVVNQSYTANMSALIGRDQSVRPWTSAELLQARTAYAGSSVSTINRMKDAGLNGQLTQFIFSDAVITKAAGNDRILSEQEPLNWFLSKDSNIHPRLLIVGALNQAGSLSAPAEIASYSNKAGTDSDVSSRFLVASGTTPFNSGQVDINGNSVNQADGTSFAAPRVAGYVAIVRSKFPNLNASQTASIMLDTATYSTLACSKTNVGCNKAIYGKGEANLSRALAPVGKLR